MKLDLETGEYRQPVPTGTYELDKALNGGLGEGELGVIIAPSDGGKTAMCVGMSAFNAVDTINKVLHLSIDEKHIDRRYIANIVDMPYQYLDNHDIKSHLLNLMQGKLLNVMYKLRTGVEYFNYSPNELTVEEIEKRISMYGTASLVIIDSFDRMKIDYRNGIDASDARKNALYDLKKIAQKYNVAMWVTFQLSGIDKEYYKCPQFINSVADVVITSAATYEQKKQGRINLFIEKCKYLTSYRDRFINVKFNKGTGKFDMSDMDDMDNAIYNTNIQAEVNAKAKEVRDYKRKNNYEQ